MESTSMDSVQRITARIGEIESRIASLRPPGLAASGGAAGFDSALGAALRAPATATGASSGSSTGLGTTYPTSLTLGLGAIGDYANGQIPEQLLAPLPGTDERLAPAAAAAFTAMARAAAADGIQLAVNDGYRTLEDQERLADELGLYTEGGLAAVPGTSNHGIGKAVDLDLDDASSAWMRANGPRFGFVNDVAREPWHWTYRSV